MTDSLRVACDALAVRFDSKYGMPAKTRGVVIGDDPLRAPLPGGRFVRAGAQRVRVRGEGSREQCPEQHPSSDRSRPRAPIHEEQGTGDSGKPSNGGGRRLDIEAPRRGAM